MKYIAIYISSILFFLLGVLVGDRTVFFQWFVNINWNSSGVANGISAIVGLSTVSAVIVALYQSQLAKKEAEKNRRDAIESQLEKITISCNHMLQPPSMKNYIVITAVNIGKVIVPIQSLSWTCEGTSTSLFQPNFAQGSHKLPYILHPREKLILLIDFKVLMNLARYVFECCNEDPTRLKAALSSNLNTFVCQIDNDLCKKIIALIDSKKEYIKNEMKKSKIMQQEYDEKKDESSWMDEFTEFK